MQRPVGQKPRREHQLFPVKLRMEIRCRQTCTVLILPERFQHAWTRRFPAAYWCWRTRATHARLNDGSLQLLADELTSFVHLQSLYVETL